MRWHCALQYLIPQQRPQERSESENSPQAAHACGGLTAAFSTTRLAACSPLPLEAAVWRKVAFLHLEASVLEGIGFEELRAFSRTFNRRVLGVSLTVARRIAETRCSFFDVFRLYQRQRLQVDAS